MEGRDSPGLKTSACRPRGHLWPGRAANTGRRCRTWAREVGSTLAGYGGKAARRADRVVGMSVLLHPYACLPRVEYAEASKRPAIKKHRFAFMGLRSDFAPQVAGCAQPRGPPVGSRVPSYNSIFPARYMTHWGSAPVTILFPQLFAHYGPARPAPRRPGHAPRAPDPAERGGWAAAAVRRAKTANITAKISRLVHVQLCERKGGVAVLAA